MRGRPTTRSEETRRKLSADVLKRPKSVDVPEMKPVPKKSGGAKPQQRTEIKKTAATNGNTTKAYTKLRAEELRAEKSESSSENEEDEGKKETKIETTRGSFVQSGAETNTTFNDPRKRAEVAMEVEELVNPSGPPPNTFWPSDAQWLRANGHSELSYEEKCDARNLYRGKNPPLVPKDMEWLIENDYAASNYEDHVRALVEDKQGESKFSSEDVKWLILAGFGGCDKDERDRGCDERDREFALEQRNKGKPWPKGLTGQVSTDLHNSKLSKVKEPEDPDKVIEAPPVKEGGEDKSSSSDEERSDTEKESADGKALRAGDKKREDLFGVVDAFIKSGEHRSRSSDDESSSSDEEGSAENSEEESEFLTPVPAAPAPRNPTPNEYKMPNTITENLMRSLLLAPVGTTIGMGVAFAEAGGIDLEILFTGIIMRYAAIGAMASVGVAAAYSVLCGAVSLREHCRKKDDLDIPSTPPSVAHEHVRHFFLPSTSSFYSWPVRSFFASQAMGLVFAAAAGYMHPVVGEMAGRGFGAMAGVALALLYHPAITRAITQGFNGSFQKEAVQKIERRFSYKESRHDVPWYTRLFFGAYIGVALSYIANDPSSDSFARYRLIATSITSAFTLFSPHLFALLRAAIIDFRYGEGGPRNGEPAFSRPHWYRATQIDFPLYVLLMSGVVASCTMMLSVQAYVGDTVGQPVHWMAGAMLPMLLALTQKIFVCCPSEKVAEPTAPRLDTDMPWYIIFASAALAGKMIGDALEYSQSEMPTTMTLQLVSVCVMTGLALLSPMVNAFLATCCASNENPEATALLDEETGLDMPSTGTSASSSASEKVNLKLPFYLRALIGAWVGAVVGAAIGNLMPSLGDPTDVFPGFIGPEFLGISNAVGAPTGTIAGAVGFTLIWPMLVFAGKKGAECFGGCFNLFQKRGSGGGKDERGPPFEGLSESGVSSDEENPTLPNGRAF